MGMGEVRWRFWSIPFFANDYLSESIKEIHASGVEDGGIKRKKFRKKCKFNLKVDHSLSLISGKDGIMSNIIRIFGGSSVEASNFASTPFKYFDIKKIQKLFLPSVEGGGKIKKFLGEEILVIFSFETIGFYPSLYLSL